MRTLLVVIVTLLSSFQIRGPELSPWLIEHRSSLRIDGKSNVSAFSCDVTEYLRTDTLWCLQEEKQSKYIFTSNSLLVLDVRRFDCHHKYITSDFRKMLKADSYPTLMIRFLSLGNVKDKLAVKGQVLVELAGKRKMMEINYQCEQASQDQIHLTGTKTMKFSDFELVPPRKIGGLIRIDEEIDVHFDLFFRKIHSSY